MLWTRVLRAGVVYFALVFGAGFTLGVVRELFLVPRLGVRTAELVEIPVMLCLAFVAAQWVVGRFSLPWAIASRLGMGITALVLLLLAELCVAVGLRGLSVSEAFVSRDPVSCTAYRIAIAAFALMPLAAWRR